MSKKTAEKLLKQYFGYDGFREGQEQLIEAVLSGRDVLGIMPTGAGKSMCFQIPALMMEGLSLIHILKLKNFKKRSLERWVRK